MRGIVIPSSDNVSLSLFRYVPEKAGQYMETGGFRVTTLIVRTEDQLLHSELLLEKLGTETDKSLRKIYHWQWKEWYSPPPPPSSSYRNLDQARSRSASLCGSHASHSTRS